MGPEAVGAADSIGWLQLAPGVVEPRHLPFGVLWADPRTDSHVCESPPETMDGGG